MHPPSMVYQRPCIIVRSIRAKWRVCPDHNWVGSRSSRQQDNLYSLSGNDRTHVWQAQRLPSRHPVDMNLLRHLLKGWHLLACIESGFQTLFGHPAIFQRTFTGLIERHNVSAAQTKVCPQWCAHLVHLAFHHHTHNPAPRP